MSISPLTEPGGIVPLRVTERRRVVARLMLFGVIDCRAGRASHCRLDPPVRC